jgi:hypothetical protein
MTNRTKTDDTFDSFLARTKENKTTVAEMAYWYWELLESHQQNKKILEEQERSINSLEKSCACLKNSRITQKIKVCNEDR